MSEEREHAFAVVEAIHEDGLQLRFDGEEEAGNKHYKCNTFFKFAVGDRVYCVRDSGSFVAICKIGAPAEKIHADSADSAENANSSKSSETAVKAVGLQDGNTESYVLKIRWNKTKKYIEYTHPLLASSNTWLPLLAPLDESVASYSEAQVVKIRSTSAGKLEYCVPKISSTTWHTITST